MAHFWIPEIPVLEKILRPAVIYFFLVIAFRLFGKRQVGELTPFDLIVLLIISNIVQNGMIGADNSVGGALIGASTVLFINYVLIELTYRSKKIRRVLEDSPTILIHNGAILRRNLDKERVTPEELQAALRKHGVLEPSQVRYAILEEGGDISVVPKQG